MWTSMMQVRGRRGHRGRREKKNFKSRHPNMDCKGPCSPKRLCTLVFLFWTIFLSNAVLWLASTFEERYVMILKMTSRETSFFHAWLKLKETVSEASKSFKLVQMEKDVLPTSLNVTGESSSKFKLVVNVYGCFVESDEHNEGHKITKRLRHQVRFSWSPIRLWNVLIPQFIIGSLGMCSQKNKREAVFANRQISTAYSLVAVIAVLQFL